MTIDKSKVIPTGQDDNNEITAMNVVGIEKDGKDELVLAETEKGKQFGEKDIMSSDLTQGVKIPLMDGGKPSKENKNTDGMEVGE